MDMQNDEDDTQLETDGSNSQHVEIQDHSSSSMACQKTPIDPTIIVCLGNLPDNLKSLRHSIMLAQIVSQENRDSISSFTPRFKAEFHLSEQSLGSNYTDEEERIMGEMTRQATFSLARSKGEESSVESTGEHRKDDSFNSEANSPHSSRGEERIDGNELIHVPQMAEKRYSWED
jgi:hypothetical protein